MRRRFTSVSLHLNIRRSLKFLACTTIGLVTIAASNQLAYAQGDLGSLNAYRHDTWAFDPNETECIEGGGTGGATTNSKSQEDNIKIILGIVKTNNLPKEAGVISIMTALTESNIRMLASKSIPVSQENPAWQALPPPRPIGNDHDSVGIFQQRISTGWSTYGNGDSQEIVWQLMDPAYSAQAFLGTPDGSSLPAGLKQPSALRKGLQNKSGWQSMDPWMAAQKVQISFDPTGGNYKKNYDRAISLTEKFWDDATPVPLPIPVTAGGGGGGSSNQNASTGQAGNAGDCSAVATGDLTQLISKYAWHQYHKAPYIVMTAAYKDAVNTAQKNGGYVGGGMHPGIDCGGYVTVLMRNSGRDPTYNKNKGPVTEQEKYVKSRPELYQLIRTNTTDALQFGDIGIIDSHTYMFVGDGMINAGAADWKGDSTSASFGGDNPDGSWRSPMASAAYDISEYRWYRWLGQPKTQKPDPNI